MRDDHDSVRASYDTVAGVYADHLRDELAYKPLDRALLRMVVEHAAGSRVADLGCGPGHVTGWLADQGAEAVGIDLSPAMIEVARREQPQAEFRVGDLLALPAGDEEFAAAVALYSIIHLQPDELAPAFGEMRRALAPGSLLLVAFHAGDGVQHRDEWWDRTVELDFRFLSPADVSSAVERAGFDIDARIDRPHLPREAATQRCYVLARRVR
ncbi:MAG: class I SAM-dependent methyltransferase [Candidatus Dormibacteraeota bacterium]|nr:class I SAM-dependent methyltransferase [Candidatus Dormibacteraeota bacterium]